MLAWMARLCTLLLVCSLAYGQEIILDRRVASQDDDAEESASGTVTRASSDLELVYDGSNQIVGMRFTNIIIPPGAQIQAAWIQFQADESQSEATLLTIAGQLAPNPGVFTSASGNISSRAQTGAAVEWQPGPWSTGQAGPEQRTPDLAPIVQEIVDQPGWASGNALVILIEGTGHRTAEAWDGDAGAAPLLHLQATTEEPVPGCPEPPFFPADFSGPTCTPTNEEIKCQCSECMTWDLATDLATIDEYEVSRRIVGAPSWTVVGHLYKSPAGEDDGESWPEGISTTWCVGRDADGPPTENVLFEYAVKACRTENQNRVCSTSYSNIVRYRAAMYWDFIGP